MFQAKEILSSFFSQQTPSKMCAQIPGITSCIPLSNVGNCLVWLIWRWQSNWRSTLWLTSDFLHQGPNQPTTSTPPLSACLFVHLGVLNKIGSLAQKLQACTLLRASSGDLSVSVSPRIISYCTGFKGRWGAPLAGVVGSAWYRGGQMLFRHGRL